MGEHLRRRRGVRRRFSGVVEALLVCRHPYLIPAVLSDILQLVVPSGVVVAVRYKCEEGGNEMEELGRGPRPCGDDDLGLDDTGKVGGELIVHFIGFDLRVGRVDEGVLNLTSVLEGPGDILGGRGGGLRAFINITRICVSTLSVADLLLKFSLLGKPLRNFVKRLGGSVCVC